MAGKSKPSSEHLSISHVDLPDCRAGSTWKEPHLTASEPDELWRFRFSSWAATNDTCPASHSRALCDLELECDSELLQTLVFSSGKREY